MKAHDFKVPYWCRVPLSLSRYTDTPKKLGHENNNSHKITVLKGQWYTGPLTIYLMNTERV